LAQATVRALALWTQLHGPIARYGTTVTGMKLPTVSLASYYRAVETGAGKLHLPTPADAVACASEAVDDNVELAELVASVRMACEEVGFFTVVDHGIDAALLEAQRRECAAFFARPPQSVVLGMVQGAASRFAWLDYVPPEEASAGPAATAAGGSAAWSLGPVEGRGSMPWQPDSETLMATWTAYYAAMEQLVAALMQLFALALGLPAGAFDAALEGHRSSMRAILYPEVLEADLEAGGGEVVRSGEHTDWGCVTVLLADGNVGGLELCSKDGIWSPIHPDPGGLVVNLGDLLPQWTSGRWVATRHRVIARHETRHQRLSIPYFGLVNRKTVLAPLLQPCTTPGSVEANQGSKSAEEDNALPSRAITAGEFFDRHEEFASRQRTVDGGR